MNRLELRHLEVRLEEEVEKRRHLGGYNSDAECIIFLTESIHKIVLHLQGLMEKAPSK